MTTGITDNTTPATVEGAVAAEAATPAGNTAADVDDVNVHADESGDVLADFKERIEAIVSEVEAKAKAVRDKLASAEIHALHEVYLAFDDLRSVASTLVPSQVPLKTPSPSLDPNHPQGLGRTLQEGETLQTGVV